MNITILEFWGLLTNHKPAIALMSILQRSSENLGDNCILLLDS